MAAISLNVSRVYLLVYEFICVKPVVMCARVLPDGHCFTGPAPVGGSYRVNRTGGGDPHGYTPTYTFDYYRQSSHCTGPVNTKEVRPRSCSRYTAGAFVISADHVGVAPGGCMDCTGSSCISSVAAMVAAPTEVFSNNNVNLGFGLLVASLSVLMLIALTYWHVWIMCQGSGTTDPIDAHGSYQCDHSHDGPFCTGHAHDGSYADERAQYVAQIPWEEGTTYPETDPPGALYFPVTLHK